MSSRHGPGTLRSSSPAASIKERGGILMKIARALATCEGGGGWGVRHSSGLGGKVGVIAALEGRDGMQACVEK